MKKLIFIAMIVLVVFSACENKKPENNNPDEISTDLINYPETGEEGVEADNESAPKFEFKDKVIEFGEISQGEKIKRTFEFTNVGKSDLIISDANGSCGCTVPIWPRDPIAPGESSEIEVVFDSEGKTGRQNVKITLAANTIPNTFTIAIKGDVLAPK